jgi:hypothetical protein
VSVGTDHACAIRATDDKMICWGGSQQYGQAPPGPSSDRFKSISDRCGVRLDDKIVCWGDNARGEAPPGPSADSFQTVSHVCGLRLDGRMVCWGDNSDGGAPRDRRAIASRASAPRAAGLAAACGSTTRWSAGETTRTARRRSGPRPIRSRVLQRVNRLPAACAPTGGWSAGEIIPTARRLPDRRPTCSRASAPASMASPWFRLRRAHRRPGRLLGVQRRRPGATLAASGVVQERERRRGHCLRDSVGRQARLLGRQRFERASAARAVGPILQERQRRSVSELRREIR